MLDRKMEVLGALNRIGIEVRQVESMPAGAILNRCAYSRGGVEPCWRTDGQEKACDTSDTPTNCSMVEITGASYAVLYGNCWGAVTNIANLYVWPNCEVPILVETLRKLLREE